MRIPVRLGDRVTLTMGVTGTIEGNYSTVGHGGIIHCGYIVKLDEIYCGYVDCKPHDGSFITRVIAHPSSISEINGATAHDD